MASLVDDIEDFLTDTPLEPWDPSESDDLDALEALNAWDAYDKGILCPFLSKLARRGGASGLLHCARGEGRAAWVAKNLLQECNLWRAVAADLDGNFYILPEPGKELELMVVLARWQANEYGIVERDGYRWVLMELD